MLRLEEVIIIPHQETKYKAGMKFSLSLQKFHTNFCTKLAKLSRN